jgi:DNA-binding FadR family transcriptional regulator
VLSAIAEPRLSMARRTDPTPPAGGAAVTACPSHDNLRDALEGIVRQREPGERLPAERALATTLNVGRALVRHVLRDLEHDGWIEVRAQSGSYRSPA